jgi:3-oxoacyl-[acyl-carrier protein] reductase
MGVTFDFMDASVLVTGGTSGIGYATAGAFATAGASVTVTGTQPAADDYDVDLGAFTYRRCRLTHPEEIEHLAAGFRGLDVLVNNAGQVLPGGRDEYDPFVFEEALSINLAGSFRLSTACRDLLAASRFDGGASVINLASMSAFFGIEMTPGYGAAKAGVVGITKTLAVAWAKHGIRVNAVAPGIIETNMTAPMLPFEAMTGPLLERTALGRFGVPEEVAPAVLFLASAAARYITGHTLVVDGGFSIHG